MQKLVPLHGYSNIFLSFSFFLEREREREREPTWNTAQDLKRRETRLTWWTVALRNVSFDPKHARLQRRPLHLQLFLNFPLQPLDKNVRRFLKLTTSFQIGDPRLQSQFPVHQQTGHGQAGNTEGAHRPIECCTLGSSTGILAKFPRHRCLEGAFSRRRPVGRRVGLHVVHRIDTRSRFYSCTRNALSARHNPPKDRRYVLTRQSRINAIQWRNHASLTDCAASSSIWNASRAPTCPLLLTSLS